MEFLILLALAVIGVLLAAASAFVPGLHVYNLVAIFLLFYFANPAVVPERYLVFLFMGMIVGWSFFNTLTSVYLSVPDESTMFFVFPGQRYLLEGRGFEAVILMSLGSLGGIIALVAVSPFLPQLMKTLWETLQANTYILGWILALIMVYLIMSEFPRGVEREKSVWGRLKEAWGSLSAGILTFILSGLFGFILFNRALMPAERGWFNITPAFIGLFGVSWALQNLIARPPKIKSQHYSKSIDVRLHHIVRGVGSGFLAGIFGAFIPAVTAGVAGFLAGHATAQRGDRLFILSQGASRAVYYIGGFLLFFLPTVRMQRGGLAHMTGLVFEPQTFGDYYFAVAIIAICSGLSFLLIPRLAKLASKIVIKYKYTSISIFSAILSTLIVAFLTSWQGLLIYGVAILIGFIPTMFYCRRSNTLAIILFPLAIGMLQGDQALLRFLGMA